MSEIELDYFRSKPGWDEKKRKLIIHYTAATMENIWGKPVYKDVIIFAKDDLEAQFTTAGEFESIYITYTDAEDNEMHFDFQGVHTPDDLDQLIRLYQGP